MRFFLILILASFFVACDSQPTIEEAKTNFYKNNHYFNELAELSCNLGKKKQAFSYTDSSYSYSPKKIKEHDRIGELDILLKEIGGYVVNYKFTESNGCSLVVGYYVRGFAGSGVKYNYSFNKPVVIPDNENEHKFDMNRKRNGPIAFDLQLYDDWFLSYSQN